MKSFQILALNTVLVLFINPVQSSSASAYKKFSKLGAPSYFARYITSSVCNVQRRMSRGKTMFLSLFFGKNSEKVLIFSMKAKKCGDEQDLEAQLCHTIFSFLTYDNLKAFFCFFACFCFCFCFLLLLFVFLTKRIFR